jgi:hypothetical protein
VALRVHVSEDYEMFVTEPQRCVQLDTKHTKLAVVFHLPTIVRSGGDLGADECSDQALFYNLMQEAD